MPTRSGYTDSSYNLIASPYGFAYDSSGKRDSSHVLSIEDTIDSGDGIITTKAGFSFGYDSNFVFDGQNTGLSVSTNAQLDSANGLISTLRTQLANAQGGGPVQRWIT